MINNFECNRHAGIVAEKQMRHARGVIWPVTAAPFVNTKTGSSIIRHAELMRQEPLNQPLKKRRHLRRLVPLPIPAPTALHARRQLIRAPQLPSPPPSRPMASSRHPSDGISWNCPKRSIYASHLEKVSSESDIESQNRNFQKSHTLRLSKMKNLSWMYNLWLVYECDN